MIPFRRGPSSASTPSWGTIALVSVLLLALSAPAAARGQEPVLEVSGQGEVQVTPDRARIHFAVETEGMTAREASEANARLMDEVIAAVRATDVEGLRIETAGYTLQPRYRQADDRQREIAGYTARNSLQVVIDDVDAVGPLVDTALGAGANRIAGLHFEIRDAEPYRREALQQAVEMARSEAEAMASALGLRLGSPTRVQGGAQRPPTPFPLQFRMEAAMADAPPTPIEAGVQTVTASVSITYRLHPD